MGVDRTFSGLLEAQGAEKPGAAVKFLPPGGLKSGFENVKGRNVVIFENFFLFPAVQENRGVLGRAWGSPKGSSTFTKLCGLKARQIVLLVLAR